MSNASQGEGAAGDAARRALRNTLAGAAGQIVAKLASFVLFAGLARAVGESELGGFVAAMAFVQISMVPVELGFDRYLLRAVAQDPERVHGLSKNVLGLKGVVVVPVLALSFLIVNLMPYDGETRIAVYVLSVALVLETLGGTPTTAFTAIERSDLWALNLVVQRMTGAAVGGAALILGYGIVAVAVAYAIGALLALSVSFWHFRRHFGPSNASLDVTAWPELFRQSFPFAVQDLLNVLLFRIDAVLLSLVATSAAVGRYGAAYRMLESTFFITEALSSAVAAMFTYLTPQSVPTVGAVFARTIKLAVAALMPCALIFGLLAPSLCVLLFGEDFGSAGGALRLLAPVVVLLGVATLGSSLIVSRASPRRMLPVAAMAVAVNLTLNLLLIPRYAELGAASALLLTEILVSVLVVRMAVRMVGHFPWRRVLASPVLAGLAMMATIVSIRSFLLAVALGLIVYTGVLALLERRFNPADYRFAYGAGRRLYRRGRAILSGAGAP